VLCLRCVYASREVPEVVEAKRDEETVNISEELRELMEEMSEVYSATLFCAKLKAVVVGNPEHPAERIDECKDFVAA